MRKLLLSLGLIAVPLMASAHPGHGFEVPFLDGLGHPVGGADHILAMVAVGLWAAVTGGRARWAMPIMFVGAMILGGIMGWSGVGVPAVEPMIVASIVLLGIAAALAWQPPLLVALAGIAVFGLLHGHAHGAEGSQAGLVSFGLGFGISTTALHLTGLLIGTGLIRIEQTAWARGLGGAVAVGGLALAAGWSA
jgi:urease accessory protein